MTPGSRSWFLGSWFISSSFLEVWGVSVRWVRTISKSEGLLYTETVLPGEHINQSCSLENPRLTSRRAEYLIWEGQKSEQTLNHAWFGEPWAGLAEEDDLCSIPPVCSAQSTSEQSPSTWQLINYQPHVSSGGQTTTLATCCSFDKIPQK